MDLGIAGRRALVAAGTAGLGLAVARALGEAGVQVVICGRDEQRLASALELLRGTASGPPPDGLTADVSSVTGAQAFVEEGTRVLGGRLDILVCSSGGPPPGTPVGTTVEQYRDALESNCLATIAMCTAASTGMTERGWGRMLGITSVGARQPINYLAASSVARAALTSYLKMLSTELAPHGVTVNNLQPGLHHTDRVDSLAGDRAAELLSDVPAGRFGDPGDFGALGAFLCSEQARFTTGVGLHVDGGAFHGLQ